MITYYAILRGGSDEALDIERIYQTYPEAKDAFSEIENRRQCRTGVKRYQLAQINVIEAIVLRTDLATNVAKEF